MIERRVARSVVADTRLSTSTVVFYLDVGVLLAERLRGAQVGCVEDVEGDGGHLQKVFVTGRFCV